MSSTPNPPDPLSGLLKGMQRTMDRDAEFKALAAKVKAKTATPEEVEKYERWPMKTLTFGGAVEITHSRPLTVEEWASPERIARRNLQERMRREAEEEKKRQG